jgi:hypothetical protein
MYRGFILSIVLAAGCLFLMGCGNTPQNAEDGAPAEGGGADGKPRQADGEHAHEHDDRLFWHLQELEHAGFRVDLGQHGEKVHDGHELEPAVGITRDGEPVADAKVFVSLLDADAQNVLVEEVSTVYEPPTADEPAHYAQGKLLVPESIKKAVVRYRIEWPEAPPFQKDVIVDVEHH